MYILLKTNETSPSHNVMLIKFQSICDCIDHDKRSKTRYPPPQIHPPHPLPPPKKKKLFLVCMQITLGRSRELVPSPVPGATGANNP